MEKFYNELKSHKIVLYNGKIYYHVTKNFIKKYLSIFENVNSYDMIKKSKSKRIYERFICML